MNVRRVRPSSVLPVIIFVLGLLALIAAGVSALTFPSRGTVAWGLLIAGAVFIAGAVIASPAAFREVFTSRKSLLWVNDIVLVAALIGTGILVSYIGFRRHVRYDLTRDKLFSISDSTIKLMRGLKKDVKVTAFYNTGSIDGGMVEDLLQEYKRNTDKLTFQLVDPFRDPISAKAMNVQQLGTVVVQCENNRKDIFPQEMFIQPNPYMRSQEPPKFQGEQALTSAVMNVTSGAKRKIHFVRNHDEPGLSDFKNEGYAAVQQFLVKENFDVGETNLMEGVGTDTAVLAVISPRKSFHPAEVSALRDFITKSHGKLLVALNPDTRAQSPELETLLTELFGVIFNNEIIINPKRVANNPALIIPEYQYHTIVKDQMEKKSGVLMQLARGISFEGKEPWTVTPFLKTDSEAFGKRVMAEVMGGISDFNSQTDVKGPLNLGIAIEDKTSATGTRAVLFGDSDFASNMLFQVQGNSDLIINTFNWLAGEEAKISIRPKTIDLAQLTITKDDANLLFYACVLGSPLIIMFLGGMVWLMRRRV